MKKLFVMVAAAIMTAVSAQAQSNDYDTKHEVAVSYGLWSNSQIIDAFENVGSAIVGARFENEKYFGSLNAEYFYHVKNWLAVGCILDYGFYQQDVYLLGDKDGVIKNNYFTLMPAVKFDWLRKQHFGMYSKLAVGATLRNEKYNSDTNATTDYDDSEVHVNWQMSFIGIEAGGTTIRGFVEMGTGEQGIILTGVRYKF